jgi:methylenetetrahydrofolate dehydrogenase (NADP+)/methenyltetrahydrofolate cyclohydrolase
MTAKLLDGKKLALVLQEETRREADAFLERHGIRPGLAAVLVGDNPASHIYVRNKRKACEQAGLTSWLHPMPPRITEPELLELVERLNADPQVHGILVQLPLPSHIDENRITAAVAPSKDVDGFGPMSIGLLAAGKPRFLPCTPAGIQQLLVRNQIPIEGAHVVIVGRSIIVGKPLALILLQKGPQANATVTVCHSQSRDLAQITRQADILVAAIGKARFITANMVRPGAAVIDVGTNRLPDKTLVGDVDFDTVSLVASAITPVPGGVGPMTIAMLLHNTLTAARMSREN